MKRQGFTLIELVVVLLVTGVVSVLVGQTLIVTDRTFHSVGQNTVSQQSLRVIGDLLEHDIRHAGLMVPGMAAVCGVDNDDAPDLLYLSDSDAIEPGNDTNAYPGSDVTNLTNLSVGTATLSLDSLVIETDGTSSAYDTNADGTNDSDFQPGAGVIITDSLQVDRGVACGRIQSVNLGSSQITVEITSDLDDDGGDPAQLVAVPAHEYRIDGTKLVWNGKGLSEGIEDFQVAYFIDENENEVENAGELLGGGGGDDYESDEEDLKFLRSIQVSIVARSKHEDPQFPSGTLQPVENRDPTGSADGYRRRVLTTRLQLRNVGPRVGVL